MDTRSLYIGETLDLYTTPRPLEYAPHHIHGWRNVTAMGGTEIRAGPHMFSTSGIRCCLNHRGGMRSLLAILASTNPSLLSHPHADAEASVTCLTALLQDWEWRG